MTEALKAIDEFIAYTRIHGPQHDITLHNLFFLQDFIHDDLEYTKNKHNEAVKIVNRMNQARESVKSIKKAVDKLCKLIYDDYRR